MTNRHFLLAVPFFWIYSGFVQGPITEKAEPRIDWFRRQRRRDRDANDGENILVLPRFRGENYGVVYYANDQACSKISLFPTLPNKSIILKRWAAAKCFVDTHISTTANTNYRCRKHVAFPRR